MGFGFYEYGRLGLGLFSFWFRDIPGSVMVVLDIMELTID